VFFAQSRRGQNQLHAVQNGKRIIGYWMPLKEEKEVYVHFGIGCAEAMGVQAGIKATCAEELVQL
jgi:hypothetical protein